MIAEEEMMAANPNPTPSVTEELKPCPFCGGPGRVESSQLSTLSWPIWKHTSRCPVNAAQMYPNREEAIAAGNARADQPPQHTGPLPPDGKPFDPYLGRIKGTVIPVASGAGLTDVERDISGETVCGFRVAAWRETHPEHGDKFGHSYSEHWSTPSNRDPRVKVERLFTEDQLRAALLVSDRSGVERDALEKIDAIANNPRYDNGPRIEAIQAIARTALDTPTVDEGEG